MKFKDILLFHTGKDGGPKSRVDGYWLIQIKSLFSVAFLRFAAGSREAYHSHAFNSISWVIRGELEEHLLNKSANQYVLDGRANIYRPSFKPIITRRDTFHRVYGKAANDGGTWVFTLRGPWARFWSELTEEKEEITLTHNRVRIK